MNLFDKKRLVEIKKIVEKYGIRLTASTLIFINLFLIKSSSYEKMKNQEENFDSVTISSSKVFYAKEIPEVQEEEMSYQDKIDYILTTFDLTLEQLDVCCAIACAEACCDGYDYEEAHNVINTAYNRVISARWVASLGDNIYDQMTAPNQFVVYQNGSYRKYLGRSDLPGYQAAIDFLSNTSELETHSYLSFRSNSSNIDGVELVDGGNLYFNLLTEEERLEDIRTKGEISLSLSK